MFLIAVALVLGTFVFVSSVIGVLRQFTRETANAVRTFGLFEGLLIVALTVLGCVIVIDRVGNSLMIH